MAHLLRFRLEDSVLHALNKGLDAIAIEGNFTPSLADQASLVIRRFMPSLLLKQIGAIAGPSPDAPILIISENSPIGEHLGDGPSSVDGRRPPWLRSRRHELYAAGLACAIDLWTFTVAEEYDGDPVHYLSPVPAFAAVPTGRSARRLGCHVDNVALGRFSPTHLALSGLRRDVPTPTCFFAVDELVAAIASEHRAILEQPLFRQATPASFSADNSAPLFSAPVAVLQRDDYGRQIAFFNEYSTRPIPNVGPGPAQALAALAEAARSLNLSIDIDLAPGTVVIASNRRCLHARGDIEGGRIVVRQYFTDDIAPFVEVGAAVPGSPGVFFAPTLIAASHQKSLNK